MTFAPLDSNRRRSISPLIGKLLGAQKEREERWDGTAIRALGREKRSEPRPDSGAHFENAGSWTRDSVERFWPRSASPSLLLLV